MSPLPPEGLPENKGEYFDDVDLMYYWRNEDDGLVYSRPYSQIELAGVQTRKLLDVLNEEAREAITLNDGWIHANTTFLAIEAPTSDELLLQIRSLTEQASYQAGTAKRVIRVLAELTGREV